jgi:hypothetical protein
MSLPAANDRSAEPDEFQLPVLGLYADLELGRGSVLLPDEFLHCSSAVQLEIIGSWQRSLARYQHDAVCRLHRELAAGQPIPQPIPIPMPSEPTAWFDSTCDSLGLDVPADVSAAAAKP